MPDIIHATTDDIPSIHSLAHQIWPSAFTGILTSAQIDYMLEWMYSPQSLKTQMKNGHRFLLLKNGDKYCGYCAFEHQEQLTKLHKIYLLPEVQGTGFGRFLMQEVIKIARNKNQMTIQLNVNRYNKAVIFYKKAGFKIIREEDNDIGNGYFMNDYVMELKME